MSNINFILMSETLKIKLDKHPSKIEQCLPECCAIFGQSVMWDACEYRHLRLPMSCDTLPHLLTVIALSSHGRSSTSLLVSGSLIFWLLETDIDQHYQLKVFIHMNSVMVSTKIPLPFLIKLIEKLHIPQTLGQTISIRCKFKGI